ncbi:MAG TPA: hypothetical protein VH327_00415 [Gammaproteobacteria bacterium]|nr:hypothetical protein [Gammaproteobacteria bacterium]
MQTNRGQLDCPHCSTEVSTWQMFIARRHKVQCRKCGAKLLVSGELKSLFFGEMLFYPVLIIPFVIFPDSIILDILSSMALYLACCCIAMRLFYKVHPIKTGPNKEIKVS